jgi:hypothetical protein
MKITAVWCIFGDKHACMAAFSAKSFFESGGENALIVVSTEYERNIVEHIESRAKVFVLPVDISDYPKIAYKTFCLAKFFDQISFNDLDYLIICDSDVIWTSFDQDKFKALTFDLWFQRATYYNSRLLQSKIPYVRRRDIIVRTLRSARKYIECANPLDVTLNAGLYGGKYTVLKVLIKEFSALLFKMRPREVKLSEALLSFVVPNLGLTVCSDTVDLNIKYRVRNKVFRKRTWSPEFQTALDQLRSRDSNLSRIYFMNTNYASGRAMATHYFGGMNKEFEKKVLEIYDLSLRK